MDTAKQKKLNFIGIILIGALFSGCSSFELPKATSWSQWDTNKRTAFVASNIAIAADWGTSLNLTERYDEGYWEKNKILGRTPSRGDVNKYFIAKTMLNYNMARYMQEPWDTWSLYFTTIAHGKAANDNIGIGLKVDF